MTIDPERIERRCGLSTRTAVSLQRAPPRPFSDLFCTFNEPSLYLLCTFSAPSLNLFYTDCGPQSPLTVRADGVEVGCDERDGGADLVPGVGKACEATARRVERLMLAPEH